MDATITNLAPISLRSILGQLSSLDPLPTQHYSWPIASKLLDAKPGSLSSRLLQQYARLARNLSLHLSAPDVQLVKAKQAVDNYRDTKLAIVYSHDDRR